MLLELVELLMDKKRYEAVQTQLTKAENAGHIEKDFIYESLGHWAEKQGNYCTVISYYNKALMYSMHNGASNELKQNINRTNLRT